MFEKHPKGVEEEHVEEDEESGVRPDNSILARIDINVSSLLLVKVTHREPSALARGLVLLELL